MNPHLPAQRFSNDHEEELIGLASLAKMAFDGADLRPMRSRLLDRARRNRSDANALMDLSTVLHLMGQRECALSVQALALDIQQVYRLRGSGDSVGIRLLSLMRPGDLVFAKRGRSRIVGYGTVLGDYKFEPEREDYKHVRRVRWDGRGD